MYIILVKYNDHLFYVTKIIWSVIDTAKDQHKSKQEVHVYISLFGIFSRYKCTLSFRN